MTPRMTNPALVLPEALEAMLALAASATKGDLPPHLVELVLLRASQINGCGVCVDMHTKGAKRDGESDERLHAVAAWRDTAYFSPDERAALALAESVTRLSDRPDPVPDEVWDEGRPPFRRGGAGVAAGDDRRDQRLQPAQRGHAPGGGVGAVACLMAAAACGSPNQPARRVRASSL